MGNTKIINNSVLADYAAIVRVGTFMAGCEYEALYNTAGEQIVKIKQVKEQCYVVTDVD